MNLDNILTATDTARVQSGGRSLMEKLGDALTAGVAGATVSGLGSIYNTAVFASNKLFDTELEAIETNKVLANVDENWARYYDENKGVLDTVGFIGGAFIPGGLAVKAMNVARRGSALGPVGRALGFTMRKQEEYLEAGLQAVAKGETVFSSLNRNKWMSMAYGAADNVLQAAVFETAAAITMSQGPVLADESWSDISWDITRNALLGGAIGGGIEALWTNGIFRQAGKAVDKAARNYDTLAALEKLNLAFGDEAFKIADSALSLPKEVFEQHRSIPFSYKVNGREVTLELKTGGLMDRKLKETADKGLLEFQKVITNFVEGDTTIGAPVARAMMEIINEGVQAQKGVGEIREALGSYLFNLKAIQSIGSASEDFTQDIMYVLPGASIKSASENLTSLFSSSRLGPNAQGYRITGPLSKAKTGVLGDPTVGKTLDEAYAAGFDIVYTGLEGKVHINPASRVFKKVTGEDDGITRVAFNTRTKQTTDTPIVTIADVATTKSPLRVNDTGAVAGKYTFKFNVTDQDALDSLDSIYNTARNLWATKVNNLQGIELDAKDFALQDRLLELVNANQFKNIFRELDRTTLRTADGGTINVLDLLQESTEWGLKQKIAENKLIYAKELLAEASQRGETIDLTALSYKLNVEQSWLEKAVAAEFDPAKLLGDKEAFRNLAEYAARENVVMVYQKPQLPPDVSFASPYVEYQHRVAQAKELTKTAAASVFGRAIERFIDIVPGKLAGTLDSGGTGASGFGFSNAQYDDLGRVWAQDVGRAVHLTAQDFRNADLEKLNSHFVAAVTEGNKELGAFLNRYRLSEDKFMLLNGKVVDWASGKRYKKMQERMAEMGELAEKDGGEEAMREYMKLSEQLKDFTFKIKPIELSPQTYKLLEAYHDTHKAWLNKHSTLANAHGRTVPWDEDALYLPPVDTKSVPFFAFVRPAEGKVMGTSEVSMITARSADELQQLAAKVRTEHPELRVLFKSDTEDFIKARGDYEYALAMNEPTLDPMLRRKGLLGDFLPTLEPQAVVEEFVRHIGRRNDNLVRNAAQTFYAQEFAELQWLSKQYTKVESSKFQFIGKEQLRKVTDPFGDYVRTALDISKRAEFTLWHQANEFVDALGTRAYSIIEDAWKAKKVNDNDWIEANKVLEQVGLKGVFTNQSDYLAAQFGGERNLFKMAVAKGNMLLANITLRLDVANSMINIISMPIMQGMEIASIRNSLKKNPQLLEAFNSQMREAVPGTELQVPSAMRLMHGAIKNFFGPEKKALLERYEKSIGSVKNDLSQFHEMLEDLAMTPNFAPKKWAENVDKWTEKGATLTGNNFSEQFTRFVASDVMRQISQPLVDAGNMTVKEQNAFISIFANRVHGNYITSQRPIAFQGTIGGAIGLFQTYMFNVFQQVFRHIEARDAKTLAVGAALQGTIFGLNGLPMFDAINTHIIGNANINEQHHDIYSRIASIDKEWGDAAMYGLASAMPLFTDKMPALYTRGDLNPRHISIVPTSFADIPVVEASSRLASSVWNTGKQLVNGADMSSALLHGLAHNGISRPLAGFATVLAGESTTSKGAIISAHNDLLSVETAVRLMGAKPMDESVAMNHKFRLVAYKAADRERIEALGSVVKEKIRDGSLTDEDVLDFASRYAASGGRASEFSAALQRWSKSALESEVNKISRALQSQYGQRMLEVMGADPLPDYLNTQGLEE